MRHLTFRPCPYKTSCAAWQADHESLHHYICRAPSPKACDCLQMIKGDPGMEDIYEWSQKQINVPLRGRTGAFLGLSEQRVLRMGLA